MASQGIATLCIYTHHLPPPKYTSTLRSFDTSTFDTSDPYKSLEDTGHSLTFILSDAPAERLKTFVNDRETGNPETIC